MVLTAIMNTILPWRKANGADALKAALAEPRTNLDLSGVFDEPRLDEQGTKTAVFPVTVYDSETGEYGETKVEFEIESNVGKERLDSFLDAYGIDERAKLDEIEGKTANVTLSAQGNLVVD